MQEFEKVISAFQEETVKLNSLNLQILNMLRIHINEVPFQKE